MIAHFWVYIETVIGVWFTGYWFITGLPEALSYVMPSAMAEGATARLDQWVSPGTRQRFYRGIFLIGIFIAGFIAWDEQYQIATSKSASLQPPITGTADVPANVNKLKIEADVTPPYEIFATPNWGTQVVPIERAAGYFVVVFSNPAPREGATVDWQVIPIPGSKDESTELSKRFVERDSQLRALQSEVGILKGREWPALSSEKKTTLIAVLKSVGQHLFIIACNDDDCESLADDIFDAAKKSGWSPTITSGALAAMQPGVTLYGQPDQARDQIAKALEDGIGVHVKLDIVDKDYLFAIGRKPHP